MPVQPAAPNRDHGGACARAPPPAYGPDCTSLHALRPDSRFVKALSRGVRLDASGPEATAPAPCPDRRSLRPSRTSRTPTRSLEARRTASGSAGTPRCRRTGVNEPREVTEIEAKSVQDRLSMVTEEIAGESAKRGGEPREGVRGRGRKRQGPAGLPALRPGMTSRTSVLVMPGRGTLARRNGRVGPDGVVDDDEPARAFGRATTRVPRKARLAHASTVGTLGVGCCARRAWRRRSRARGPRPDGR